MSSPPDHAPGWTEGHPGPFTGRGDPIHVWRIALEASETVVAKAHRLLAADERDRARRFHSARDRTHFILARAGLRILLASYCSCGPDAIAFRYSPHGKPLLDHPPCPPGRSEPAFNLSHSGGLALVAIAPRPLVGIDVEHLRPIPDADRLVEAFFSDAERSEYELVAPADRPRAFFHGWTRKEAFTKAVGDGLSHPLRDFDVTLAPERPALIRGFQGKSAHGSPWRLVSFVPAPDFVAAVATNLPEASPRFLQFDPAWLAAGDCSGPA